MPAATRTEAPERYSAADFDSDSEVETKMTLQDYVKSKNAPLMPKKAQRQVDTAGFEAMAQLPSKKAADFIQAELAAADAKAAAVARAARTTTPPPVNPTTTPTPAMTTTTTTVTAPKTTTQPQATTTASTTPTPSGAATLNACGRGKSTRRHRKPLDNFLEAEDGDWVVLPKDGLPACAAVLVR